MPILFLSPTDLLFYRHLHGNTVWNCAVFSINYFHSLITNFRRQTFHCWPPREWIVLQRDCIREMSPQWKQKGMKTLCLIYIKPNTSFPVISLLNLYLLVKGTVIDPGIVIPQELLHKTEATVLKSKSVPQIKALIHISVSWMQNHQPPQQTHSKCSWIMSIVQI